MKPKQPVEGTDIMEVLDDQEELANDMQLTIHEEGDYEDDIKLNRMY
jgi:hypothetical protein